MVGSLYLRRRGTRLRPDDDAVIIEEEGSSVLCIHPVAARGVGALLWQVYEGFNPPPNPLVRNVIAMADSGTVLTITPNFAVTAQLVLPSSAVVTEDLGIVCGVCGEQLGHEATVVVLQIAETETELFWHQACLSDFLQVYQEQIQPLL